MMSMEEVKNKFVAIKGNINGAPAESDFEIKSEMISLSLNESDEEVEIIVKNLYVSVDPYQLNRMKAQSSSQLTSDFATAITPGQAIDTYGVGRVVVSRRADVEKGDLVVGLLIWGDYTLAEKGRLLNKLDPMAMGMALPHHVGALGFSGLTAYGGFYQVCKPKKGESIFVSAASGSVGSLVGQYAKLFGCRVVGCAGSQTKIDLLKGKLGFDDAFNYKEETDFKSALKKYFPEGIDMYFDNVGGELLDAVVANMNNFGRVAVCGAISEYTGTGKRAALDMLEVVYKRITIQGFLAADFMNCYADFIHTTAEHLRTGKMESLCQVSRGAESVPHAFVGLFSGDNIGKVIVQIGDDE